MLPVIKVYDIDYSFIIKNYLNPEMWQKEWTLFVYKNFVATLRISSIDCCDKKVSFKISVTDKDNEEKYKVHGYLYYSNSTYSYASYFLSVNNIDLLKQSIQGAIKTSIRELEERLIRLSPEYIDMEETKQEEKTKLREIASNFLDSEKVTNEDIRDAYIDWYVDKMIDDRDFTGQYIVNHYYTMLTDVWYVFANIINDQPLLKSIESIADNEKIEEIKQEYDEYKEYIYSEQYKDDMADGLEDL